MSGSGIFLTLFMVALVTIILRALPFIMGKYLRENVFLTHLRKRMPIGVMCLLVIFTIKNEDFLKAPYGIPVILSSMIAFLLYWYGRNPLISIFSALIVYLIFTNFHFISNL